MTKTIAVVAANGRTGHAFVEIALAAGYNVRAGYHRTNNLKSHPNLVAMKCEATNEEDVRALLQGADAVVSLIGHVRHSPALVQTDSIRTILAVMNELNISRIISLTGTGVRFPGDTPNTLDWVLNKAIAIIDPKRINDGIQHVRLFESSNVNWTIIRVLKLSNRINNRGVKLSLTGPAELLTSRKRVGLSILQVLDDEKYVHTAPIIQGDA